MDISIISEYFPRSVGREMRGGVEARAYFLAKRLSKRHQVRVVAIREHGFPDKHRIGDIKVERVGPKISYTQAGSLWKRSQFMRAAASALRDKPSQIVDGAAVMGYPAAWWAKAEAKVITYHDVWVGRWIANVGVTGLFGEAMEKYVLTRDWNGMISVSEYTKNNLLAQGIDADLVTVAPNGIDLATYMNIKAEKDDAPTICCVARLVAYKKVADLIRATAALEGVRVKVVGTGPERERLEYLSWELGIADRVEFLGYVEKHDEVLAHIKSSHCLCLPSAVEGFGITVIEAMALGVPYVASDIPAIREASRDGTGGLLYPVGDVSALVQCLDMVLTGEVKGGYKDMQSYDWNHTAKKVEGAYKKALG